MRVFKSLRLRVILFVIGFSVIPVLILHLIIVNSYEYFLINQRQNEIRSRFNLIAAGLGNEDNIYNTLTDSTSGVILWYSEAYAGRVLVVDNECKVALDSYGTDVGKTVVSDAVFKAFQGISYRNYSKEAGYIESAIPIRFQEEDEPKTTGVLIFSSSVAWIKSGLNRVENTLNIVEVVLFVILVLAAVYVSWLMTRPLKRVSRNLGKFHSGHIETSQYEFQSYTEVDDILASANVIIDKYREMEESQEEFVSNVSHELRTPLTSVKVLTDSLVGQKNVDESVYQEFLSDISQEVDRESMMIDDLLSMARLTGTRESLNIRTVNINEMLLSLLNTLKPIALKVKVELVYESFRMVNADVDEIKLSQAVSNFIENGIKYNKEGGYVKTSLDSDHEFFYIRVEDNGAGIPEDSVGHIFERFYRVDKDRSRDTGGTGLGLAIARQIILLHDGVVKVESKLGEGTAFTLRIPLKQNQKGGGRS
ncbi:MAG: two-component sensor histidine kinase [Lachnospiraceae bacterium]|nr:two-component sensor histidine kinase [Lachnospiraceae bacterium]